MTTQESSLDPSSSQPERDTLAILTLRRHQDGVWIHRLVEALQCQQNQHQDEPLQIAAAEAAASLPVQIQVIVLEDFLQGPFSVSGPSRPNTSGEIPGTCTSTGTDISASFSRWRGLINRVSDAAEPWEVKACLALLQLAKQICDIPVWNGPDAYSLCTHKWCHHVLFQKAQLESPDTVVSLLQDGTCTGNPNTNSSSLEMTAVTMLYGLSQKATEQQSNSSLSLDYLVKPNAGGFGAGIERRQASMIMPQTAGKNSSSSPSPHAETTRTHMIQLDNLHPNLPNYSDRTVLFQKYVQPNHDKIYRVWFLMGKVQCAVERTVDIESSKQEPSNDEPKQLTVATYEFTSGCVGGVCQRPRKEESNSTATNVASSIQPWSVPDEVKWDIEEKLIPVLPKDAHCGSVEFLYSPRDSQEGSGSNRLYFDLNLLSTLPVDDMATADPWVQLASAIWAYVKPQRQS